MYDKIHCFKENCPYRNIFRSSSVGGYIEFFLLIITYIRTEKINSEACHCYIFHKKFDACLSTDMIGKGNVQ